MVDERKQLQRELYEALDDADTVVAEWEKRHGKEVTEGHRAAAITLFIQRQMRKGR